MSVDVGGAQIGETSPTFEPQEELACRFRTNFDSRTASRAMLRASANLNRGWCEKPTLAFERREYERADERMDVELWRQNCQ
jgi:hypothetical protein